MTERRILLELCSTGTFTCQVKNWRYAMAKGSLGKSYGFETFLPSLSTYLPLLKARD